jgi:hypothetical protein
VFCGHVKLGVALLASPSGILEVPRVAVPKLGIVRCLPSFGVKTLVLVAMGAAQIAFWLSSPCAPAPYDKRDGDANECRQDDTSDDSLDEDFIFVHR